MISPVDHVSEIIKGCVNEVGVMDDYVNPFKSFSRASSATVDGFITNVKNSELINLISGE
jgi:hypothetical protein